MAEVLRVYPTLLSSAGRTYEARACAREKEPGDWEGWIELLADDGSPALRTERETTQPNRRAIEYWAEGLTPVYLEGALERALEPPPAVAPATPGEPVHDRPAPSRWSRRI
jgi:hypothetical protein